MNPPGHSAASHACQLKPTSASNFEKRCFPWRSFLERLGSHLSTSWVPFVLVRGSPQHPEEVSEAAASAGVASLGNYIWLQSLADGHSLAAREGDGGGEPQELVSIDLQYAG